MSRFFGGELNGVSVSPTSLRGVGLQVACHYQMTQLRLTYRDTLNDWKLTASHLDVDSVEYFPSMYGIFINIYHKHQPNVGKYTIHGWNWGILWKPIFLCVFLRAKHFVRNPPGSPGMTLSNTSLMNLP